MSENFIWKKKLDWTMFNVGTVIPVDLHDKFQRTLGEKIGKGDSRNINLIVNNIKYNCNIYLQSDKERSSNVMKISFNNELKELLKTNFEDTYNYIMEERNKTGKSPKVISIENEGSMIFYESEHKDEFIIKLSSNTDSALDYNDVILKKLITAQFFTSGFSINKKFRDNFFYNSKMTKSEDIDIIYKDNIFKERLYIEKNGTLSFTVRKEFTDFLKEKFNELYDFLESYNKNNGKYPCKEEIPNDLKTYILFYRSETKNRYYIDFVMDDSMSESAISEDRGYREIENEIKELKYIKNYIKSKGYTYSDEIIDNLYLSLKTKPFVILSGISGTGKSKIIKLFAEAIGATTDNGRFNLIPVRPDWSDDSELIGYRDIEGKFKAGIITSIAKAAMENSNEPYFICLDEMNLARVEYYFSTILSLIETREFIDGEIKSNKLLSRESFGADEKAYELYGDVYIPENIYVIGTVNMDETTFPFSKKVLDRANTIEFNEINLDYNFDEIESSNLDDKRIYDNTMFKSPYVSLSQCKDNKDVALKVISQLKKINEILKGENYHFAYRVRDEIVFYVINAVTSKLMTYEQAMDYSINQKILPKISGSNREVLEILVELFNKLNGTKYNYDDIAYGNIDIKELENIESKDYKVSSGKIIYMLKKYVRDGFTGFW